MKRVLILLIAGAVLSGVAAYTAGIAKPITGQLPPQR
jgi:uncharacterized membrane protein YtjA (UPF0391 family)